MKLGVQFDIVSRIGGEEFTIVLPDCPVFQAVEIAERIRAAVQNHMFILPDQRQIQVTVSIGIATYPDTTDSATHLYQRADDALYQSKRLGRNRVSTLETFALTQE